MAVHGYNDDPLGCRRSGGDAMKIMPLILTILSFATATTALSATEPLPPSPIAVVAAPDGSLLYTAVIGSDEIIAVEPGTGAIRFSTHLPQPPVDLGVAPDGKTLLVTVGNAYGKLLLLDTQSGKIRKSIPTGHTPGAPVATADGKTVFVCERFNNQVGVYEPNRLFGQHRTVIPVLREPITAALTPDENLLLVGNHLPAGRADGDYAAATVSIIDVAKMTVAAEIPLANGATAIRQIALSPDGQTAYVSHILARYQVPATQIARGWVNTNALAIIDVASRKLSATILLDDLDLGAANPWGVAVSADGKFICVAHSGTHEISIIDRIGLHKRMDAMSEAERDGLANQLGFLGPLRRRVHLAGQGPRRLAVIGDTVYASCYFSDNLATASLTGSAVSSLPLGSPAPETPTRRGEFLFHDATYCFQNWMSCTSCHPDSRTDALNWDLPNDGLGTPKNTKNMLYTHETPPTTVTGIRANAETSVRAGIRFFRAVLPEEDAVAIDTYMKSLRPVPSPELVNGKLSKSAERGKVLFDGKAHCAKCHDGTYYTDMKRHDVGTGIGLEVGMKYDVPTLLEAWRTAPYLHDGRAATIHDLLTTDNPEDEHGHTQQLTPQELNDLAAYVRSL